MKQLSVQTVYQHNLLNMTCVSSWCVRSHPPLSSPVKVSAVIPATTQSTQSTAVPLWQSSIRTVTQPFAQNHRGKIIENTLWKYFRINLRLKIGRDSEVNIPIPHELEKLGPSLSNLDTDGEGNKWVIPLPISVRIGQKWEEPGFISLWEMGIFTSESHMILRHKIILKNFHNVFEIKIHIVLHRSA